MNCPDCALPLNARVLERPRRPVPMAACRCGGAWLELDALTALLGEVALDPLAGDTSRRCPHCTLTLATVLLPGVVPVETCTACRGVWLDWPDVLALRDPALEALLRPPPELRYAGLAPPDEPSVMPEGASSPARSASSAARAPRPAAPHTAWSAPRARRKCNPFPARPTSTSVTAPTASTWPRCSPTTEVGKAVIAELGPTNTGKTIERKVTARVGHARVALGRREARAAEPRALDLHRRCAVDRGVRGTTAGARRRADPSRPQAAEHSGHGAGGCGTRPRWRSSTAREISASWRRTSRRAPFTRATFIES